VEPSAYSEAHCDYIDILWALEVKLQKLELQKPYEKLIKDGVYGADRDYCVQCLRLRNPPDDEVYDEDIELPF